jgi:diphosphomevalonate decarboxylase
MNDQSMMENRDIVTSQSHINIALIKYWGKAQAAQNIPAVGSLSLTLAPWGTTTSIQWSQSFKAHRFELNQQVIEDIKVFAILDELAKYAGFQGHAWVVSENSVPTASGLASSASGMSALVHSAWHALKLGATSSHALPEKMIELVRKGSGSAVRSLLGGFVRLEKDGKTLSQIQGPAHFKPAVVVAVMAQGPKEVLSRDGMTHTKLTSPYFQAWIDSHQSDLDEAQKAIEAGDLRLLGEVMEHSTAKMHALAWSARPPLRYLKGESFMLLDQLAKWKKEGIQAWSTMDAGPHIKLFCQEADAQMLENKVKSLPYVLNTLVLKPGEGTDLSPKPLSFHPEKTALLLKLQE